MVVIYYHHGNIGNKQVLLPEEQKELKASVNHTSLIVFITMVKEMLVQICAQLTQNQVPQLAKTPVKLHTMLLIIQIYIMEQVLIMLTLMLQKFKLKS